MAYFLQLLEYKGTTAQCSLLTFKALIIMTVSNDSASYDLFPSTVCFLSSFLFSRIWIELYSSSSRVSGELASEQLPRCVTCSFKTRLSPWTREKHSTAYLSPTFSSISNRLFSLRLPDARISKLFCNRPGVRFFFSFSNNETKVKWNLFTLH